MATLQEKKKKSDKSSYVQMTQGKIRIAQEDFDLHLALLNEARNKSDILFELLAYGILEIKK